jgi:hypothetical protein
MSKSSPIQSSFNAGEFGPELDGRVDIGKYVNACSRLENFFPLVQGPARRRGGTRFVAEVKDSTDRTWLARFEFNTTQAYIIEFGDQYVRFFTDNGSLLSPAGSAWATPVAYAVADVVTNGGNKYYCKTAHTSGATFAGDAAYWYQLPATGEYEIPSPWAIADLTNSDGTFALRMVQSGDILYICHPSYVPRKLSRTGATAWNIAELETEGGPFEDTDPDETVTVYASAATGSGVTLTASAATFASTDVGRLFYLEQKKANAIQAWEAAKAVNTNDLRRSDGKTYKALNTATTGSIKPTHSVGAEYDGGVQWEFQDPGYGWVRITAYSSATAVTCTVLSQLPDQVVLVGNATTRWAFGAWGSVAGYPSHVSFFRERLVLARALDRRVWFSVSGDYENFKDRDTGGRVTADMAISIEVQSDQSNPIQYLMPTDNLIIGTAGAEHICRELTDSEPFGPENITVVKSSSIGSRAVQPVQVGEAVLFVQRSGRKLREVTYDALQDGYKTTDVSILAPHLVPKGKSILHLAYQKEPHSIVWGVRSDGMLLGFTFNREQDVVCWHRHVLGGAFGSGDAVVECVETVPSPEDDRDDLWMIVKRTVDGGTKRYIEFMQPEWENGDAQEDAFYVDCGLTYDGAAADTISGLDHLEGETVDVLADGASHPQCVVASGAITLQRDASVVQIGLPCPAKMATMRLNAGAADGTAQGKTKRINRIVIRLLDTLGGEVGPTETETDEILFRSTGDAMDAGPPIFTGDKELAWRGGYEKDAFVWYVNEQPFPATVVAIMPSVVTQDR